MAKWSSCIKVLEGQPFKELQNSCGRKLAGAPTGNFKEKCSSRFLNHLEAKGAQSDNSTYVEQISAEEETETYLNGFTGLKD